MMLNIFFNGLRGKKFSSKLLPSVDSEPKEFLPYQRWLKNNGDLYDMKVEEARKKKAHERGLNLRTKILGKREIDHSTYYDEPSVVSANLGFVRIGRSIGDDPTAPDMPPDMLLSTKLDDTSIGYA